MSVCVSVCVSAGINQQWGLSNELFVLGDSLVLTVLGQVSFMPVLVLAARLCPEVRACPFITADSRTRQTHPPSEHAGKIE